ncbi:hypothetical protein V8G54_007322 [Vigna mungo]|uniref:Uncharacterized protein n=1 Tax=Vigna mungo TaxID=3915 RepID=A0AAQ3P1N2_VIGMU
MLVQGILRLRKRQVREKNNNQKRQKLNQKHNIMMPPSRSIVNLSPMGIPHAAGPENMVPPKHIGVSEESPKYFVGIELVFKEIARRCCRRRPSPPPPEGVHLAVVEIIDGSGLVIHPSRTVIAQTLESLRDFLECVF